jgi:hypothetical protein
MTMLKLTCPTDNTMQFTDTTSVSQDTDLDVANPGKNIGYDITYITTTTTGNTATADSALAIDGGFLYATFTSQDGQNWSGNVTGGTGKFQEATGTVTAKTTGPNDLAVVVDYDLP